MAIATVDLGSVKGPQGIQGIQGPKGDKGDMGAVSDTISTHFTIGTRQEGPEIGLHSFTQGNYCVARKDYGHAEGENTDASEPCAHAEGSYTTARAAYSHAQGKNSITTGYCSHAGGFSVAANVIFGTAIGSNNKLMIGNAAYPSGTQDLFVIGNGIDAPSSNAFRVSSDGAVYALKQYNASGADYAEYFEWIDGNPDNEDRVGRFVTFSDGDTIKIADDGDYILGISSGNPCVIGNSDEDWIQRWSRDEFGRMIFKKVPAVDMMTKEVVKDDDGVTIMSDALAQNPEYNPEQPYIQRKDRKEWDAIGMVGVLSVYDDGTCQVNGYCKCADGGIATAADRGADTYRVIGRVADNIIKVVLK